MDGGNWTIAADLCVCHRAQELDKIINEADPEKKYRR